MLWMHYRYQRFLPVLLQYRLMNLYERWQDEHEYDDFSDYRVAAFESCPGLTALWAQPFRAEYVAADGTLVLRFRLTDESIEIAADITK